MVPFALLQLVSGTLARAAGAARGSCAAATSPSALAAVALRARAGHLDVLGRAGGMGAANAFLSPILLAALSEVVAPEVLGRTVGTFAAAQTAGLMLAPILGGLLGRDLVAARLRARRRRRGRARAPAARRRRRRAAAGAGRARVARPLLNRWIALSAAQATLGYLGFTAIGFVLVLVGGRGVRARLGRAAASSSPATAIGGILLGRYAGTVVDRAGRPATALAGRGRAARPASSASSSRRALELALVFFAVGCASAFVWAGLNTIAVESFPENRAGATSAYSAFKFAGVAIAPLIYVPLFNVDTRAAVPARRRLLGAPRRARSLPWFARYR